MENDTWPDSIYQNWQELPYTPDAIQPEFIDTYGRSPNVLLSTLVYYATTVSKLGRKARFGLPSSRIPIPDLPAISRFLDISSTADDFDVLLRNFPPDEIDNRLVYNLNLLRGNTRPFQSLFKEQPSEQIVFYQRQGLKSWAIFLVMTQKRTIDGFFFGHITIPSQKESVKLLQNILSVVIHKETFIFRHRLHLPPSMAADPTGLVYIFVNSLHLRYNYLKLSNEKITELALKQLHEFIIDHDSTLGRLRMHEITMESHPYCLRVNIDDVNFEDIRQHGWSVINVVRDGNCGYYSLLLGIENCESKRYCPHWRNVGASMSSNTSWQQQILQFRQDMQLKSQQLIKQLSNEDPETIPWLPLVGITEKFPLENLSDEFFTINLTKTQYFDDTLLKDENVKYQLSPFWGNVVAALLFEVRIVVYIRTASWDGLQKSYTWTTLTCSQEEPMKHWIVQTQGIQKLPHDEFYDFPTIELVYTMGSRGRKPAEENNDENNQFQFLRRVILPEKITVKSSSNPSHTMEELIILGQKKTEKEAKERMASREVDVVQKPTQTSPLVEEDVVQNPTRLSPAVDDNVVQNPTTIYPASSTLPEAPTRDASTKGDVDQHPVQMSPNSSTETAMPLYAMDVEGSQPARTTGAEGSQSTTKKKRRVILPENTTFKSSLNPSHTMEESIILGQKKTEKEAKERMASREVDVVQKPTQTSPLVEQDVVQNPTRLSPAVDDDLAQNPTTIYSASSTLPEAPTRDASTKGDVDQHPMQMSPNSSTETAMPLYTMDVEGSQPACTTGAEGSQSTTNKKQSRRNKTKKKSIPSKVTEVEDTREGGTEDERTVAYTQVKYSSESNSFYIRKKNLDGVYEKPYMIKNLEEYDTAFLDSVRKKNGRWVKPPAGDAQDVSHPFHLMTKVPILYQQHGNNYCISYSLGSTLFYCGFLSAAEVFYGAAEWISTMSLDDAMNEIRSIMKNSAALIGLPTLFNIRPNTHSKKIKSMTWQDLLSDVTPFPTLVVPLQSNGSTSHVFCIVDDLIFDAIFPFALKLCVESVQWIFNNQDTNIYAVYRFCRKADMPDVKIEGTYKRQIQFHWDHPRRSEVEAAIQEMIRKRKQKRKEMRMKKKQKKNTRCNMQS